MHKQSQSNRTYLSEVKKKKEEKLAVVLKTIIFLRFLITSRTT